MVRAGWGVVYSGLGAEYGGLGKDAYLAAQAEAQYVFILFYCSLWQVGLIGMV